MNFLGQRQCEEAEGYRTEKKRYTTFIDRPRTTTYGLRNDDFKDPEDDIKSDDLFGLRRQR